MFEWEAPVRCPEWDRLVREYIAVVKAYREAVSRLVELKGPAFDVEHDHVEQLRITAEFARKACEEYERKHGCVPRHTKPG